MTTRTGGAGGEEAAGGRRQQGLGGGMTAVNIQSGYSYAGDTPASPHTDYIVTIHGSR